MKRALIGGFLSLIGLVWCLAIAIITSNQLVSGWSTPPGRFITTLNETGMTGIFVVGCIVFLLGILVMGIEYFRKD